MLQGASAVAGALASAIRSDRSVSSFSFSLVVVRGFVIVIVLDLVRVRVRAILRTFSMRVSGGDARRRLPMFALAVFAHAHAQEHVDVNEDANEDANEDVLRGG